ncbi:MAG: sulfite exporter TauE/SafE family protein [Sphingomonadales bacterium]|nr:sulfite exporter TauE/SafE family protein [Sphingomonadales bacterium]
MFDLTGTAIVELLPFILIGFAAQLVDGALGMAFGVISNTLLLSLGIPPHFASASVHTVEVFTTGVSGISHTLHRNVDWWLFIRIVAPGMIGGILGAYVIVWAGESARPVVLIYLAGIGLYLLWKGARHRHQERRPRVIVPLGLAGGFLDASGGGGWGPIVTSNLLIQGANPRKVIGTVNTAEFFLTLTISGTFLVAIGVSQFTWSSEIGRATLGLLIGGIAAAPLGGYIAKRVPADGLLVMVGIVLTLTSAYGIWRALS